MGAGALQRITQRAGRELRGGRVGGGDCCRAKARQRDDVSRRRPALRVQVVVGQEQQGTATRVRAALALADAYLADTASDAREPVLQRLFDSDAFAGLSDDVKQLVYRNLWNALQDGGNDAK